MQVRRAVAALAYGLVVLSAGRPAEGQVAFRLLQERDGFPWWMRVSDISADGRVVVGHSSAGAVEGAFLWTAQTGYQGLGPVVVGGEPIALTAAFGVSGDASVITGTAANGQFFRWVDAGSVTLHGDDAWSHMPAELSDNGDVLVGRMSVATIRLPFHWTVTSTEPALMADFPEPSDFPRPYGLSGDGRVAVGWALRLPGSFAWKWTETDGYTLLPTPDMGRESYGRAFAASFDGSVIVGEVRNAAGTYAAAWSAPDYSLRLLGELPGGAVECTAYACSADGSVIVGYSSGERGTEAVIWLPGATQPRSIKEMLLTEYGIDIGERVLSHAIAVSADGRVIAGDSYPSDGLYDPWLLRLDPDADCPCDFDDTSAAIDVRDVAAFVNAWFDGEGAADFNNDGAFDIQDILDFLDCWFPAAAAQPCSSDPGAGG